MSEFYTPEEVADRFKITRKLVMSRIATKTWPCLKLGGKTYRFTEEHIQEIEKLCESRPIAEEANPWGLKGRGRGRANFS